MDNTITLSIDARGISVEAGVTVAAAIAMAGSGATRRSVGGAARAPLCGMGICQECRVDVDGRRVLACQTTCSAGMRITTDATG